MADFIEQKGKERNIMVAGIVVLALALIIAMKFFMSESSAPAPERAVEPQQIFKKAAPPSGLKPGSRSERNSGGGLDMFSETNAGFYGEKKSTAAAEEQAAPVVVKAGKPAAVKAAPVKAKPKGTVIPRLKPTSFDKISPTDVSPGGTGQGMPDIADMMKRAKEQQSGSNDASGN